MNFFHVSSKAVVLSPNTHTHKKHLCLPTSKALLWILHQHNLQTAQCGSAFTWTLPSNYLLFKSPRHPLFSSSSLCPLTLQAAPFSVPVLRCCSIVVVAHNFDLSFKTALKVREEADGLSLTSGLSISRTASLIKNVFYVTAM